MKKIVLVLMIVLFLSSSLFAQASSEAKNPVLRIITWSGYAPQELLNKFTEETGYKVEVTLSNNEEMISKLRATRGGGFDLAQPSQDRISSVVEQYGIYQPIDYTRINTEQIDPSLLEAVKKNTLVNGKSYAVPHVYGTEGLVVNKALAPDVKDFKDLLNPTALRDLPLSGWVSPLATTRLLSTTIRKHTRNSSMKWRKYSLRASLW